MRYQNSRIFATIPEARRPHWPATAHSSLLADGLLDQPARLRLAELADQVVARRLDGPARGGEIGLELEVLLEHLAVDEDGLHVRDIGGADDGADRIDDRSDVHRR